MGVIRQPVPFDVLISKFKECPVKIEFLKQFQFVSRFYGLTPDDALNKKTHVPVCLRQAFMRVWRYDVGLSQQDIADITGYDRASIIHAVRIADDRRKSPEKMFNNIYDTVWTATASWRLLNALLREINSGQPSVQEQIHRMKIAIESVQEYKKFLRGDND